MDSVYGHYNQNASEKINIKEYFSRYSNIIKPCYLGWLASTTDQSILKIMKNDLGNEEMDLLSEYCRYSFFFLYRLIYIYIYIV